MITIVGFWAIKQISANLSELKSDKACPLNTMKFN